MSEKKSFVISDPKDLFYGCMIPMRFEEYGARRRVSLRLIPNVEDPEAKNKIVISKYKSSRKYKIDLETGRAKNDGGYRLCRASRCLHPLQKFFWEFKFYKATQKDSHVRLGIATCSADMEAPVGVDEEGYSVRDLGGAFHESRNQKPEQYLPGVKPMPGFSVGDTIGFGFTHTAEKETTTLEVFINGVSQGVIFHGIDPKKEWIPSFSCYHGAVVEAHFEDFDFDPGPEWIPVSKLEPEPQTQKYNIQQMLELMKYGTESLRTKEMVQATDAVLTPVQDMPI